MYQSNQSKTYRLSLYFFTIEAKVKLVTINIRPPVCCKKNFTVKLSTSKEDFSFKHPLGQSWHGGFFKNQMSPIQKDPLLQLLPAKRSASKSIITGSGNTTSHSPQNRGGHEMNYVWLISLKIRLEVSCAMRLLWGLLIRKYKLDYYGVLSIHTTKVLLKITWTRMCTLVRKKYRFEGTLEDFTLGVALVPQVSPVSTFLV